MTGTQCQLATGNRVTVTVFPGSVPNRQAVRGMRGNRKELVSNRGAAYHAGGRGFEFRLSRQLGSVQFDQFRWLQLQVTTEKLSRPRSAVRTVPSLVLCLSAFVLFVADLL